MASSSDLPSPAVEAVRRARAYFEREGDPGDFRAFEAFVLRSTDARTYREVAGALGMSVPEVRARVLRVRERIREELKAMRTGGQGNPETASK